MRKRVVRFVQGLGFPQVSVITLGSWVIRREKFEMIEMILKIHVNMHREIFRGTNK